MAREPPAIIQGSETTERAPRWEMLTCHDLKIMCHAGGNNHACGGRRSSHGKLRMKGWQAPAGDVKQNVDETQFLNRAWKCALYMKIFMLLYMSDRIQLTNTLQS